MSFNPGIVICSRLDSERLPNKVARNINGIPLIVHLIKRLQPLGVPIVLAVPDAQMLDYSDLLKPHKEMETISLLGSIFAEDPLARTHEACELFGFSHVIRITHDKIFVDTTVLKLVLGNNALTDADYVYSSTLIPGTGFEVISAKCLKQASISFKKVEHISYAARLVSKSTVDWENIVRTNYPFNLLIDFPEDLKLMEVLIATLGSDATLDQVLDYLKFNPDIAQINAPPVVTFYTCAHNADKWLDKAMESVAMQTAFKDFGEYILIDDHSFDRTYERMAKFSFGKKNVTWIRNDKNLGLASSSNIALKKARGKYLIRLDADDFFLREDAVMELLYHAQRTKEEAIYPNNYFGNLQSIQKGKEVHHVGGALFDKRALNFIKFTDGLRNFEGLDLFERAKNSLKIGYYNQPTFFYRQHNDSMSKTNLEEREKTKLRILSNNNV